MKTIPNWIKTVLFIIIAVLLVTFFEWYGLIGFIIFMLGMFAYRLYLGRELLAINIRAAETRIFGKPLEKEYWNKGELKNHKVKIIWRKKHGKKRSNK